MNNNFPQISNAVINIRVIATIVIVFYHCTCPFHAWSNVIGGGNNPDIANVLRFITLGVVYDTMLPTFFLISGMIYFARIDSYNDRIKTFWKKFDRLFIPVAIVTSVCLWLRKSVGLPELSAGHLWFVEVLGIYFIITLLLYKVKPIWLLAISLCMHGAYVASTKYQVEFPWEFGHILKYFVYFAIGYYADFYYDCLAKKKVVKYAVLVITLFLLCIRQQTLYSFTFNALLLCFIPNQEPTNGLWLSLNRNSFAIYLLHHPIVVALLYTPLFQDLYSQFTCLPIALMFVLALVVSWVWSEGLHKVGFNYF